MRDAWKVNGDNTAVPLCEYADASDFIGLTKREYIAAQIMGGFGGDPSVGIPDVDFDPRYETIEDAAYLAVKWTDALLKALEVD
jgi:hypothetical protein